jgi:hypothetical protein
MLDHLRGTRGMIGPIAHDRPLHDSKKWAPLWKLGGYAHHYRFFLAMFRTCWFKHDVHELALRPAVCPSSHRHTTDRNPAGMHPTRQLHNHNNPTHQHSQQHEEERREIRDPPSMQIVSLYRTENSLSESYEHYENNLIDRPTVSRDARHPRPICS